MEDKTFSVYMHDNKINHKKYIGITGQDPEIRWRKGTNYRTCVAFNRAIQKYGWDSFDHIILYTGQSEADACQKEIEQIKEFRTQDPEFGYNICAGGGGVVGMRHTEEFKKNLAESMKGENNPNYGGKAVTEYQRECARKQHLGKKASDETKKKLSIAQKSRNRHMTDEEKERLKQYTQQPVQRDDGVIFPSVRAAAASIGRTDTAIINAMKRNNRSGGYYWKRVEKCLTTNSEECTP